MSSYWCDVGQIADPIYALLGEFFRRDASSVYPQPGRLRCTVLDRWHDASGRELVRVDITYPDPMETTEGLAEFVVPSAQVSWIPRGHHEENPKGAWKWVDDKVGRSR